MKSAGLVQDAPIPPARWHEHEKSVAGMAGVREDLLTSSCSVDCRSHGLLAVKDDGSDHPLQSYMINDGAVAVPGCDAASQDTLDGKSVTAGEFPSVNAETPQPPEEEELLPLCPCVV